MMKTTTFFCVYLMYELDLVWNFTVFIICQRKENQLGVSTKYKINFSFRTVWILFIFYYFNNEIKFCSNKKLSAYHNLIKFSYEKQTSIHSKHVIPHWHPKKYYRFFFFIIFHPPFSHLSSASNCKKEK